MSNQKQLCPHSDINILSRLKEYISFAEFKQLIDRVLQIQRTRKLENIAVISEFAQEGKTFFSTAFGIGYANRTRSKTLIVDTTTFTHPDSLTLERTLELDDRKKEDSHINHTLVVNVDALKMIEFQPSEPEAEESKASQIIETYQSQYGLILFDTCALSAKNKHNIDPLAVARQCQSSILIISKQTADAGGLKRIKDRLEKEHVQLLGIVYNAGKYA